MLDAVDRLIVNKLQGGFPLSPRPYAEAATKLGIAEEELIARLGRLLAAGVLTRFGPMFNADRLGGAFCLCAMSVPAERFEETAIQINARPEVAHNYAREHALNMWFVIATERAEDVSQVIDSIERETGLPVHAFPKLREFFVELKVPA